MITKANFSNWCGTAALVLIVIFSSCKKNSDNPPAQTGDYASRADAPDSAYLYAKEFYLWPEKLPSQAVFQPRNTANIFALMDKIRTYQPLDKWSFAELRTETQRSKEGSANDFGFLVKFIATASGGTELRVNYVYAASSAGLQGVKRGWRLNKVNGRIIDRNLSTDLDYINNVLFGEEPVTAQFEFTTLDNKVVLLNLSKNWYTLNTVLYKNVYTKGDRKIGYLVFNEFSDETSKAELVKAFEYFEGEGVNEMILDLRYNRGGYVSTQDALANRLAPKSVGSGIKTMYTYQYNSKYSEFNTSTKFSKVGSLDLKRIVFIVSRSSASASELLINNLKPVMNTILVGEKTYGKPVGFSPIPVFEYNIFPVSFKTVNSNGEADYFGGFKVDKNVSDDLIHDFGDENEANLKEALNFLSTGSFIATVSAERTHVSPAQISVINQANAVIADHVPSLTIENRPSKMPEPIRRLQH